MSDNRTSAEEDSDSTPETHHHEAGRPQGADAVVLDLDGVFEALDHPRRRYLLYTLINGSSEESLAELATTIAAWEREKPEAAVTDDERTDVQLTLYHSHVPKLANLGVLEYREDEDIIVRARNTEQVQAVLDGAGAEFDARQEEHARGDDV
jgi:hypothetical protein